ncbi:Holliday junction resolvase YqgF [Parvibaculum lavamentivorans DS-1]|uniref:Putative pre-16S rRNA nuclease n=1 Tax=Parvibaculum lavamentivorans (strain DS-1 / DSM 13023 / NCIMB 13966) TaxID=402881 RepID=A7HX15_PARL1|nr:Holliday junction resolvase YqgF [Parvibaculum lavamentivorans DS-1]
MWIADCAAPGPLLWSARTGFFKESNRLSGNLKPLAELKVGLGRNRRLIGVDLGSKTIGLALSDVSLSIASPLETIRRTKFTADAERLIALAKEHDAGALVFGLPLNMDGTEGPRCQSTRAFIRNLEKLTDLPIAFWDERLSTMAVTRTLLDADASRARRAELVDKMAAAYILQGALDRLRKL